jgi:hypothetical protein
MQVNSNAPFMPAIHPFPAAALQNNALRIVDSFYASGPSDWSPPHGSKVVAAARATGYQGPVVSEERLRPTQNGVITTNARILLSHGQLPPEQTLQVLETMVVTPVLGLLVETSQSLERATKAGVHGAVTNFSLGESPASRVEGIYGNVAREWGQGNDFPFQNLARAWNLDFQALTDPDPVINGPVRASFQQHLIDQVQAAYHHPILGLAQQAFRSRVDAYEANGNSVVVSAGNEGEVLQRLQTDNGGHPLRVQEGFNRNALATGAVTSVGAQDANYQIAPYSSTEGVSIYACGQLKESTGTSFAAPRVAAVMAQLHRTHPHWTSAQVEARTEEILSPQKAPVPREQPDQARAFMRSQRW